MDQFDLDSMFDNMLGELDIISQQLEESSTEASKSSTQKLDETEKRSSGYSQNSSDTSSSQGYSKPPPQVSVTDDASDDIDLSEMLNDLTDWEHNLTSGQGQMPAMKSASQDSGIGFNGNSLPRNTNLSAQYGVEGSPQFNTLKRATTGGPSVTFGDEDELSLTSLEKDIEQEKREQDKSRQLTAEELAALSPVMQELDDLVSDLSNLSFQHDYDFARQASERKQSTETSAAAAATNFAGSTTMSQNHVPPAAGQGASGTSHLHNATSNKSVETPTAVVAPYETVSVTQRMERFHSHAATSEQCHANGIRRHSESENVLQKRTVTFQHEAAAVSPTRRGQFTKWPPENTNQKPQMMNGGFHHDVNHQSGTKPPMPPPVGSKPKLPEKPQPQREQPFAAPGPKPALPVKRQTSVKAPANLSGILAKRLHQQNSLDTSQRSPTSPGPVQFPGGAEHGSTVPNRTSLLRQNSAEIRMAPPAHQNALARHHSTSRTSIKSSVSATGSIASVRSSSSAESTASETSMHSADERLSRYSFVPMDVKRQLEAVSRQAEVENLTPEEREERIKAEKMRIALEKLKEARIQKLVVKVYNKDDSSKTLVVDERMTTRTVLRQLLEKNHYEPSINWAIIEELPSLYMERIFEEHEQVTEMLSYWTRDTTNQVRFLERKDKYALFRNPQHYLLTTSDTEGQMAERQKQTLIEEFFSGRSGTGVPEVQGTLYLKGDSKSWAKKYCVLRTSGLYCSKGGEPKKGKKVSDLQCLVMFEQICVYLGRGWKKKYKSPTDYGFALKHPAIQTKSKHIKYFCCDDVRSLMRWIVGIRCAKYGKQLKENYDKTNEEMKGNVSVSGLPFQAQQSVDSTSTVSTDSGDPGSRQNTLPRANLSNVFEGAWQRASQQENAGNEGPTVQRVKSVWKPQQAKTNNNWWDLSDQGGANDAEDSSGSATISNRTSATSNIGSVISNNRISVSSTGSHGSNRDSGTPTFVPPSPSQFSQQQNAPFKPPTPSPVTAHHPPAPPPMMGMPQQQHKNHMPPAGPYANKGMPPPPPMKSSPPPPAPAKSAPPPPMKNVGPPPPPNKPHHVRHDMPPFGGKPRFPATAHRPPQQLHQMAPPPPPLEDMPPPPPADDFMPPPPPMEDLPPPPMDDDMPLPPPMEVTPNPGLPKGLRGISGPAPVRLPMLPMFNNGGFPRMRMPPPTGPKPGPPPPGPKPIGHGPRSNMGYPPPPTNNYNYSNNKPPLPPREDGTGQAQPNVPPFKSRTLIRKPSNPNYRPENGNHSMPTAQAPLTRYYNSNASPTHTVSYKKNEFPPPPEFVQDLKDTFHQVNYSVPANKDLTAFDLPPPPPELLLSEVMSRRQPPIPPPKSAKPAPPPPKRSPSTKLSFKRR